MKKKGNAKKRKKFIRKLQKRKVTRKYGYIPKNRHFCIICKLFGITNKENLTVHHHEEKSNGGTNEPQNLEVLCEKHHEQLHHRHLYRKVKLAYATYRKAKFNKIQTT